MNVLLSRASEGRISDASLHGKGVAEADRDADGGDRPLPLGGGREAGEAEEEEAEGADHLGEETAGVFGDVQAHVPFVRLSGRS